MFQNKKTSLGVKTAQKKTSANAFVAASQKKATAQRKRNATTTSLGNGAVKVTTTDNDFVDDFGKVTNYKTPRTFAEISKTMQLLWSQNKEMTVKLLFYIRMITRQVVLPNGTKTQDTQRGQGLKHEGIFRMIWLAVNHPSTFWKNINVFISVGSWKDVITMLQYDLVYNGWEERTLEWDKFGQLILAGLENPNSAELIKKYLPQIKSSSNQKTVEAQADTMIAKWISSLLFGQKLHQTTSYSYKQYRQLKTSGTAHDWQKAISQHNFLKINFNTIHGRALAQIVSGKFLKNAGLETSYQKWLETKPVARFTGFPYELFKPLGTSHYANTLKPYQEMTINKQFLGLIETAKKGMKQENSLITVIDSSGSMTSNTPGTGLSAYSIAKSMALYFSYLLKGAFAEHFLEFSNETIFKTWKGSTPVEKFRNEKSEIVAGTNFLSVADHFGKMLRKGVPESDFPSGILCVSDGCFNSTGNNKSNTKMLKQKLTGYGFSPEYVKNFKVILWDIPNSYYGKSQTAFEDFADTPNLFHMSGLDPAAIAFITGTNRSAETGTPKNSEELLEAALNQEVLDLVTV